MNKTRSCSLSGVYAALVGNKDGLLVLHCPKGCSYINSAMKLASQFRSLEGHPQWMSSYPAICVSNIEEQDAIFGGEEKLRICIEAAIKQYIPKYIVVANSCVGGVIGDDTLAVAQEMQQKYSIPVINIPYNGFLNGDYYDGYVSAAINLSEQLMCNQAVVNNTVTMIGLRSLGLTEEPSMEGLIKLLNSFGLTVKSSFPSHASFQEIQQIPSSAFTIVYGGSKKSFTALKKIGLYIEDRWGVPFFDMDYPAGWTGIVKWVNNMGSFINKPELVDRIIESEKLKLDILIQKYSSCLANIKVVVGIGRSLDNYNPEWMIDLLQRVGARIQSFLLYEHLTANEALVMRRLISRLAPEAEVISGVSPKQITYYIDIDSVGFVLSTDDLAFGFDAPWVLIPFAPGAGVEGMQDFLEMVVGKL